MSSNTSGPWEVARTDAGIIVRTESVKKTRAGASRYAAIGGFDRSDPEQLAEALANARLIAAAPKMYALLAMRAKSGDNDAAKLLQEIDDV